MRLLVGTGVFSASISRRRRARFEPQVGLMAGNQIFLAAVTVAELRSAVHIRAPLLTADAVFDDVPGLNTHR